MNPKLTDIFILKLIVQRWSALLRGVLGSVNYNYTQIFKTVKNSANQKSIQFL